MYREFGIRLRQLRLENRYKLKDIAAVCNVSQPELTRLRGQCIQEIRKTNGLLSFETALNWQQDG